MVRSSFSEKIWWRIWKRIAFFAHSGFVVTTLALPGNVQRRVVAAQDSRHALLQQHDVGHVLLEKKQQVRRGVAPDTNAQPDSEATAVDAAKQSEKNELDRIFTQDTREERANSQHAFLNTTSVDVFVNATGGSGDPNALWPYVGKRRHWNTQVPSLISTLVSNSSPQAINGTTPTVSVDETPNSTAATTSDISINAALDASTQKAAEQGDKAAIAIVDIQNCAKKSENVQTAVNAAATVCPPVADLQSVLAKAVAQSQSSSLTGGRGGAAAAPANSDPRIADAVESALMDLAENVDKALSDCRQAVLILIFSLL